MTLSKGKKHFNQHVMSKILERLGRLPNSIRDGKAQKEELWNEKSSGLSDRNNQTDKRNSNGQPQVVVDK